MIRNVVVGLRRRRIGIEQGKRFTRIALRNNLRIQRDPSKERHAHIRRRRVAYGAQRDALVRALTERLGHRVEVAQPDQGLHLVAYLKDGLGDQEAEALADANNVTVQAISRLYRGAAPRQGLLLGFSGFPVRAMAPGVARLARAIG